MCFEIIKEFVTYVFNMFRNGFCLTFVREEVLVLRNFDLSRKGRCTFGFKFSCKNYFQFHFNVRNKHNE